MVIKKGGKTAFIYLGNSGGSAFDVGASKVLFKKIKPDFIFATSMGASNAGFILKNKNYLRNINELGNLWECFDSRKIFKVNPEIFYKTIFAKSLFKNDGLKYMLSKILGFKERKIEDSPIPFHIGAYDNTNKKTVLFNKGNLLDAVMATCAAPLFFPPYKINNIEYLDGAINNRACVDKAIELGCRKIFLINVASKKIDRNDLFKTFRKSLSIMKIASI